MSGPRGPVAALAIGLLLLFLYLRSPIDLVPDRIGLVGLLDDLVVLLLTLAWLRRRLRTAGPTRDEGSHTSRGEGSRTSREERSRTSRDERSRTAAPAGAAPSDPYTVLGVPPGASRDEITRAYRAQIKRYHPDRVADLGEELQRVAHCKTIEIQRAYEALARP